MSSERSLAALAAILFLLLLALPAHGADPEVRVEAYKLPEGAYPHDVAPAPQGGLVWYTEQRGGALGILDPKTGKAELVPLGPGAAPHGVIAGPDGAAWLTDPGQNAIVRVDPASHEVQRFPLPGSRSDAGLNTAVFDPQGMLWFTGYNGLYGRLEPRTGQIAVRAAPRGSGPYGITATRDGVFYASLGANYLGRIDVESLAATALDPPTRGQGARRVWADSKGDLWVSEWNAGQVARYRPTTNEWKEWRLPGRDPHVYAVYVDESDKVWLSEWSANAIVRFDPESERFASFPIARPGADVRQIAGRPGEVWTPESGTGHLVVYRTR
jgi:virginiamycin B lyase